MASVDLINIKIRLHADGRYKATPEFGFPTGPEQRAAGYVNDRLANMVFRPDGTYDVEFLDRSP